MKTTTLLLIFISIFALKACAETIVIHGDGNPDESRAYHMTRFAEHKAHVDAEIQRRHEKEIEIQKFANALMLEYAKASNVNVSVRQFNNQSVKTKQNVTQNVEV